MRQPVKVTALIVFGLAVWDASSSQAIFQSSSISARDRFYSAIWHNSQPPSCQIVFRNGWPSSIFVDLFVSRSFRSEEDIARGGISAARRQSPLSLALLSTGIDRKEVIQPNFM
jgi:hypothetical protein